MARKTMWAVAGALLAFAPAASALQFDVELENPRIYASEVITGADAAIDYESAAPTVEVTINFLANESAEIAEGDAIELEFAFSNAVFAENVRSNSLTPPVLGSTTGVTGCNMRVMSSVGQGREGDSSVRFTVEADDAACANGSATFAEFDFELPRLMGLNTGANREVRVAVTIDAPGGSGWPTPADEATATRTAAGVPVDKNCATSPTSCTRIQNKTVSIVGNDGRLIRFAPGLEFSGTSTGSTDIDFDNDRTTFARGLPATLGSVTVGVASASECKTDTPQIDLLCVLQLDGKEFTIDRNGDGQGELKIAVTGDFREDDAVWLEHNGERGMQDSEMLEMQDDGSMTGAFRLTDVAGTARAASGPEGELDLEQGVARRTLHYMPNGEDPLRPASFRSSFEVDFSDSMVSDKPPMPASSEDNEHRIDYPSLVIEATRHAYAIPGIGADDIGNVRIKCEVATECTVYLECDDAAGDSWFAELSAPIEGRATHVIRSSDIAEMLNVGEDGWEGMLSCSVLSTRQVSVQLLTRAAGVLVNNTYVERD